MAQASDASGDIFLAGGAAIQSKCVHDGLMTARLADHFRLVADQDAARDLAALTNCNYWLSTRRHCTPLTGHHATWICA